MIPKKLHLCWLSDDAFPPFIENCINSWKKYLPDYDLIIWNTHTFDIDSVPWVKQAFISKKYAFAADYIRLYALYTEGGIYLDSDVEVLKNIDSFLLHKTFMGLETSGNFEPAIIGAEPKCDWIGECLKYYKDKSFINESGTFDLKPLPLIVGDILRVKYNVYPRVGEYTNIGLYIYSEEYFSPKCLHTQKILGSDKTVMIHHFDSSWVDNNIASYFKNAIHRCLLFVVGRKYHNKIVTLLRRTK